MNIFFSGFSALIHFLFHPCFSLPSVHLSLSHPMPWPMSLPLAKTYWPRQCDSDNTIHSLLSLRLFAPQIPPFSLAWAWGKAAVWSTQSCPQKRLVREPKDFSALSTCKFGSHPQGKSLWDRPTQEDMAQRLTSRSMAKSASYWPRQSKLCRIFLSCTP